MYKKGNSDNNTTEEEYYEKEGSICYRYFIIISWLWQNDGFTY